MKHYVKQVNPSYQESPMDFANWDEVMYPGLVLTGNKDYREHTIPVFDLWRNNWEDADNFVADLENWGDAKEVDPEFDDDDWNLTYRTLREIIEDLLPPQPSRGAYSDEEISKWKSLLRDMAYCSSSNEYRPTLQALDLLTGGNWKFTTLRGCVQGEWQECYYDSNQYTDESIRNIEIEYFNLGTEWIVHDENSTPQHPDEVSGYSCYVYGSDYRKELSEIVGCNQEDLVIYKYAGEVTKTIYSLDE